ncbi:bacterial regulatory helix-turn-helix, lysR family protein [Collimonas arenae]|nr:bacterial regulatory helix-turn-helix, lysR family protein [Collimonas arenae]
MDKLKQIEAFVSVVEKGSLASAALEQDITPVMLGRRIDALEKRLGTKLMHRTTRHLTLTEQGTVFLDHCRKLLTELDIAEKSFRKVVTRLPAIWWCRPRLHSAASMSRRMRQLL